MHNGFLTHAILCNVPLSIGPHTLLCYTMHHICCLHCVSVYIYVYIQLHHPFLKPNLIDTLQLNVLQNSIAAAQICSALQLLMVIVKTGFSSLSSLLCRIQSQRLPDMRCNARCQPLNRQITRLFSPKATRT